MLCKPCVHVVNTSSMDTVVHEDNVQHCVQSLGEHHTGSIRVLTQHIPDTTYTLFT